MIKTYLLLISLVTFNLISAQVLPKKKQAEEFVSSKLYVVIPLTYSEYIEYIDQLKLNGLFDAEKTSIIDKKEYAKTDEFINKYIKIIEENWTKNIEIEFINQLNYYELMIKNKPQTPGGIPMSILEMDINFNGLQSISINDNGILTNSIRVSRLNNEVAKSFSISSILHNGEVDYGEILLGILRIQSDIQLGLDNIKDINKLNYFFEKNGNQFSKRTLILLDEDLSEDFDIVEIKKSYPYSIEIVEKSELNQILLEKDETKLVLKVVNINDQQVCYTIFLPESGEIANSIIGLSGSNSKVKNQDINRYLKRE